jgi:hypothetical protein
MSSLVDVCTAVAALVASISGIRRAPTYPEESLNIFPFVVVYPGAGSENYAVPGERLSLSSIVVELHVARKDMPRDIAAAMPYGDSIPNKLMLDPTVSGKADTFGGIEWTFGELNWGAQQTLGFRFTMLNVKRRNNVT